MQLVHGQLLHRWVAKIHFEKQKLPEHVKVTNKSIQALVKMKKLIDSGESGKIVGVNAAYYHAQSKIN